MTRPLGLAFARRIVMMALLLCAAGVPLLPTNEMKVVGTLLAGVVLLVGAYVSARSGEPVGRSPLDVPAFAFLVLAALSTVFAVNPRVSLVPNVTRGEGLLDYVVYVPMALAAARLSGLEIREILAVVAGGGALIGAIAVGQYYGADVTAWIPGGHFNYARSWGTLSNPDFLGGYAALVLPISAALAAAAPERWSWWGYGGAGALLYAGLLGSQTRSAWVGAAVGAVILLRFLPRSAQTYRRLAVLGLIFAAVTAVMVLTRPQTSFSGRAASALNPADSSMQGRFWIWEHSAAMIRQRPVLGWGFSSVLGHLPGIGTPEYYRIFGRGVQFIDIAHNDLLQVSVNMGLLGLAAYLWIWATVLRAAYGAARAVASPLGPAATGVLAGLVAYFVWLQFLWSHIGVTNVFWVLAGIAVALSRGAALSADGAAPTG